MAGGQVNGQHSERGDDPTQDESAPDDTPVDPAADDGEEAAVDGYVPL